MSTLPVWKVRTVRANFIIEETETDLVPCLQITCPWCSEKAYVSPRWGFAKFVKIIGGEDWHERLMVGRSCPHCMKTAQVPEGFEGGMPREQED